jgi:hypothetical protein
MMELPKRHATSESPLIRAAGSGGRVLWAPWQAPAQSHCLSGSALMLATSSHCARLSVALHSESESAALRALSRSGPLPGGDH